MPIGPTEAAPAASLQSTIKTPLLGTAEVARPTAARGRSQRLSNLGLGLANRPQRPTGDKYQVSPKHLELTRTPEPEATNGAACPANIKLLSTLEVEKELARLAAEKLTEHAHVPEEELAARVAAAADPNADGGEVSMGRGWLSKWKKQAGAAAAASAAGGKRESNGKMRAVDAAAPSTAGGKCGSNGKRLAADAKRGDRNDAGEMLESTRAAESGVVVAEEAKVARESRPPSLAVPEAASDEGEAKVALEELQTYLVFMYICI